MRLQHLGVRLHKRVIHCSRLGSPFPFLFKKSLQNHCFCLLTETVINPGKSSGTKMSCDVAGLILAGKFVDRDHYRMTEETKEKREVLLAVSLMY